MKRLNIENLNDWIKDLKAGEQILLSGVVYTARDAAHKRLFAMLDKNEELPFPLADSVVYYAGPTPAKNGFAVGSCGPTTSSRMDKFYPRLADLGMKITIGKGDRAPEVYQAIRENGCVYLCALGGGGALCAGHIVSAEVIAFEDLGCESIKRFVFSDMPLWVGIDSQGNSIFKQE